MSLEAEEIIKQDHHIQVDIKKYTKKELEIIKTRICKCARMTIIKIYKNMTKWYKFSIIQWNKKIIQKAL